MGLGNFIGNLIGGATTETLKGTADTVLTSAERIKTLVTGVLPPERQAEFDMEYAKLQSNANLAQTEINKIDAASGKFFQAGWRPAVAWSGVLGLLYSSVFLPLLTWLSINYGIIPPPAIDAETLTTLLYGLLGLGSMRTFEKVRDVHHRH